PTISARDQPSNQSPPPIHSSLVTTRACGRRLATTACLSISTIVLPILPCRHVGATATASNLKRFTYCSCTNGCCKASLTQSHFLTGRTALDIFSHLCTHALPFVS